MSAVRARAVKWIKESKIVSQDYLALGILELSGCCLDGHYSYLFIMSFIVVFVVVLLG